MAEKRTMGDAAGAAVAGILTAIAFPKINAMFLAWISLIPLFFLLAQVRPRRGFLLGWIAGTFFYGILIVWIPNVPAHYGGLPLSLSLLIYVILILLLGLTWAVFGWGFALLRRRLGEAAFYAAPFLWVALEYAATHLLTGFPWGLLGLSQFKNTAFIQVAAITGIYGVSFLLVMFQSLFVGSVTFMKRIPFAFATIALAAVHLAGFLAAGKVAPGPETFSAAVIQGNVSSAIDWNGISRETALSFLESHLDLSRKAIDRGARLVVWPEFSVPLCFSCGEAQAGDFAGRIRDFVEETKVPLLVGTVETDNDPEKPLYYNTALGLSPGRPDTRYAKRHLVPFGEYIPYKGVFGFVRKLTGAIGELTPGRDFALHRFGDIPFGSPICYEVIFPNLVRRFAAAGARFLVTITNDGWYGRTSAPYQHFAAAVFRAVENRRFVLRAATTGVSGIIDPHGRVLGRTAIFTKNFLVGDVTPVTGKTFYTRFGDVFAYAALTLSAFFLILALLKRRS